MKKRLCFILVLALACSCLFACGKVEGNYSAEGNSAGTNSSANNQKIDGISDSAGKSSGDTQTSDAEKNRKLIKDVSIQAETLEFDNCVEFLRSKVSFYNGYVESSNITGSSVNQKNPNRSAKFVLRVPTQNLEEFVNLIGENVSVMSKTENTKDVTLAYIETESQAKALRIEMDRLLEWMEKANNVNEMIELEERLSQVRAALEYQESILRNYDNLVEFSKITVDLSEVVKITPLAEKKESNVFGRMWRGLCKSAKNLGHGLLEFLVWFVSALPYLIFFAGIVVLMIWVCKKIDKKEKKKAEQLRAERAKTAQQNNVSNTNQ